MIEWNRARAEREKSLLGTVFLNIYMSLKVYVSLHMRYTDESTVKSDFFFNRILLNMGFVCWTTSFFCSWSLNLRDSFLYFQSISKSDSLFYRGHNTKSKLFKIWHFFLIMHKSTWQNSVTVTTWSLEDDPNVFLKYRIPHQ